eukprot:TRINITY_DN5194_c0_g1_i1.p1 TRINITY_DN5194_c0_g1~~TRINITY_DN5194_c0_g1_i1.p1  ORF type:complete len:100 (-),score=1.60 TRINITY_DN5194_c0_g1_i1:41-340(-)
MLSVGKSISYLSSIIYVKLQNTASSKMSSMKQNSVLYSNLNESENTAQGRATRKNMYFAIIIIKISAFPLSLIRSHQSSSQNIRAVSYTHLTLPTNREV